MSKHHNEKHVIKRQEDLDRYYDKKQDTFNIEHDVFLDFDLNTESSFHVVGDIVGGDFICNNLICKNINVALLKCNHAMVDNEIKANDILANIIEAESVHSSSTINTGMLFSSEDICAINILADRVECRELAVKNICSVTDRFNVDIIESLTDTTMFINCKTGVIYKDNSTNRDEVNHER